MTSVRMVRGAVVGPEGRTAAPGELVTLEDSVAALLVGSGKAVPCEAPSPAVVEDREPVVAHRDPAPRRKR